MHSVPDCDLKTLGMGGELPGEGGGYTEPLNLPNLSMQQTLGTQIQLQEQLMSQAGCDNKEGTLAKKNRNTS